MKIKNIVIAMIAFVFVVCFSFIKDRSPSCSLPLVAIANYGPHASLDATIVGIKKQLAARGFVEGKTVRFALSDVAFDPLLIPQMLMQLKSLEPAVMVVLTTPIAQSAKGLIEGVPLVYSAVTDPVLAGLITRKDQAAKNMTGSSERQDLSFILEKIASFVSLETIGLLYATTESNDQALVEMMHKAAAVRGIKVYAIPIDKARDVEVKMPLFKGRIDALYVAGSGPIQPTLPVIAAYADDYNIPIFNFDAGAVYDGMVFASCGVSFEKVGSNAGALVADVLEGRSVGLLQPSYPTSLDYITVVSAKRCARYGCTVPKSTVGLEVLE